MNVAQYIRYIQSEIKDKQYDDYVHAFYEYKEYLEHRIKEKQAILKRYVSLQRLHTN